MYKKLNLLMCIVSAASVSCADRAGQQVQQPSLTVEEMANLALIGINAAEMAEALADPIACQKGDTDSNCVPSLALGAFVLTAHHCSLLLKKQARDLRPLVDRSPANLARIKSLSVAEQKQTVNSLYAAATDNADLVDHSLLWSMGMGNSGFVYKRK